MSSSSLSSSSLLLLLLRLAVLSCFDIMPACLMGVSLTSVQENVMPLLSAKAGILHLLQRLL